MITYLDLMLAASVATKPEAWLTAMAPNANWCYSEKVDGIRVLAADGRLITRNGYDITEHFPEVEVPHDWWLDAEIAVVGADGKADFEATNRRAKGGHGGDATLFVFDTLGREGRDLRDKTYHYRWLEAFTALRADNVQVLGVSQDGHRLWREVVGAGGEGVIARLAAAHYSKGRSPGMVKLKHRRTSDVIVVGRTPGNGSRADSFGALQCAVIDADSPGGFRQVGEVGSGFSNADIVDVMEKLAAGKPFVIEVAHLGYTSTGKIRQASFHRIREDVDVLSCVGDSP